ncbi:MAG TPA: hypothetical protein VIK91_13630 [Nannocystis sp.]
MSVDRPTIPPRAHVSTSGTFAAVPQGFDGADGTLRYLLKSEFIPLPAAGDTSRVVLRTPTEWGLLDLGAVDLADVDLDKVGRDLEILRNALAHPAELRQILAATRPGATPAQQAAAVALAAKLGLTEKAATDAGGGLLGTLFVVGAALLLSCQFAHCNKDKEETTPPDK